MIYIFSGFTAYEGKKYEFPLHLDMGRLSERQDSLSVFYEDCEDILKKAEEDMKKLREDIKAGEKICVCISDDPAEICGMCYIFHEVSDLIKEAYIARMPEFFIKDNSVILHRNWSEALSEDMKKLIVPGKVNRFFIDFMRLRWNELSAEDKPLRVLINGKLTGADEDFYDGIINFSGREFTVCGLIGEASMKNKCISPDGVLFRIAGLIKEHKLLLVREGKDFYSHVFELYNS